MPPLCLRRAQCSGSISFGLVNVPVRVYTAVHEHKLSFRLVHESDDGPIGYQKICKLEDKPVPDEEIVRTFEISKDEFVRVDDEDLKAVQVEGTHTIDLEDFVPYEQIDPTFFAHTYLIGPQEGAERPYALLVRAMEESGLSGIGKFVLRNRQYLGCLRVRDGAPTLEQMYFADEVDPPEAVLPGEPANVPKRELEMALSLINTFAGDWQPDRYKDAYHDELLKVLRAKAKGEEIHRVHEPVAEGPPDLMEALRRSLEQMERAKDGRHRSPAAREPTKAELEERAKELDIPGRSKMTKDELAEAVAAAE